MKECNKHFNREELVDFFSGDEEILRELVKSFCENHKKLVTDLSDSIKSKDYVIWERSAHTLKSLLNTVQALEMAEISLELEEMGRNGISNLAEIKLEKLKRQLDLLVLELSSFLKEF